MKKAHLDQRRAASLHATPYSATTGRPYVFTETSDLRSLLRPDLTEEFVREVLNYKTIHIQTKAQGDENQYQWIGDPQRAFYCMRLLNGQLSQGAMQRHFSLPGQVWGSSATIEQINRINFACGAVFYTLNPLKENARRCDENIEKINFLALDLDKTLPPDEFPLPPTCKVETSPGHHQILWRVEGVEIKDFKRIQQGLAQMYGGDPAISNPSCMLRLPLTINNKYGNPVPVKLVSYTRDQYTADEFFEAFPQLKLKKTPKNQQISSILVPRRLPIQRLELYAKKAVQGEVEKVLDSFEIGRHRQLYRSAAALGNLVGGEVLDEAIVVISLLEAALFVGVTEHEALRTIENGVRKGKLTPRRFGGRQ